MGVLFEISIVCHVLCSWLWRGVGVSLFFGGLFWLVRRVFSGFWGFLVSCLFCSVCWGGWRVVGGSGGSGLVRPGGLLFLNCWGAGWGVRLRAPECLASSLLGGRVRVRVLPGSRGGGWVVPGFLFVFAVLLSCSRGVFGCCFFRPVLLVSSGSAVLGPLLGCGFRGVGGLWGVSGWVRGCFFSGFCCTGPGLFPVSFCGGLVWVWVGFCLESLILAQDERWRRA